MKSYKSYIKEGYELGLRDAMTILQKMVNESTYSADQIEKWVEQLNKSGNVEVYGNYCYPKQNDGWKKMKSKASSFEYEPYKDTLYFNCGKGTIGIVAFSKEWETLYSKYGFNGDIQMDNVKGVDSVDKEIHFLFLEIKASK